MWSFFENIADAVGRVWDFLVFIWQQVTDFFRLLKPALSFVQDLIRTLPPIFSVFGIAILLVLVIYIIVGRTAGGD